MCSSGCFLSSDLIRGSLKGRLSFLVFVFALLRAAALGCYCPFPGFPSFFAWVVVIGFADPITVCGTPPFVAGGGGSSLYLGFL